MTEEQEELAKFEETLKRNEILNKGDISKLCAMVQSKPP